MKENSFLEKPKLHKQIYTARHMRVVLRMGRKNIKRKFRPTQRIKSVENMSNKQVLFLHFKISLIDYLKQKQQQYIVGFIIYRGVNYSTKGGNGMSANIIL